MGTNINQYLGLAMMSGCGTCLVYRVDKGLGVVPTADATDEVAPILTREDGIDQEGELTPTEHASDQKFKGWSVRANNQSRFCTGLTEVGLKAYRSRIGR